MMNMFTKAILGNKHLLNINRSVKFTIHSFNYDIKNSTFASSISSTSTSNPTSKTRKSIYAKHTPTNTIPTNTNLDKSEQEDLSKFDMHLKEGMNEYLQKMVNIILIHFKF